MNLLESLKNVEIKEKQEYINISELGHFDLNEITDVELKEFSDKEHPELKYTKYIGIYKENMVIIPITVMQQLKIYNEQANFTNFNVTKTGMGLNTKYIVIPAKF